MTESHIQYKVTIPGWRSDDLVAELLELWDGSVKRTHTFVSDSDRQALRVVVKEALYQIGRLLVCSAQKEDGSFEIVGFAGIDEDRLEMLFIRQDFMRRGAGHFLIGQCIKKYGVRRVSVNEDNPGAYAFYQKEGFVRVGRSEKDGRGRDFPLLHLELLELKDNPRA